MTSLDTHAQQSPEALLTKSNEPVAATERSTTEVPASRKIIKSLGKSILALGLSIPVLNPIDVRTLWTPFSSGEEFPRVNNCAEYQSPSIPTVVVDEPGYTDLDKNPITDPLLQHPHSLDASNNPIPKTESSMNKNSLMALSPVATISQYYDFFDNQTEQVVSPLSGIIYQVYVADIDNNSDYSVSINADTILSIEAKILSEDVVYNRSAAEHFMACVRQTYLNRDYEGEVWPVVIPSSPACLGDTRVQTELSDENCKQSGFTMPDADIRFLDLHIPGFWRGIDLTPQDRLILLTTGNDSGGTPSIDTSLLLHEMTHSVFSTSVAGYRAEIDQEESTVDYLTESIQDAHGDEIDSMNPVATYTSTK